MLIMREMFNLHTYLQCNLWVTFLQEYPAPTNFDCKPVIFAIFLQVQ